MMGRLPTGRFLILPAKTPGKQTGGYRPFISDDATVAYRPKAVCRECTENSCCRRQRSLAHLRARSM